MNKYYRVKDNTFTSGYEYYVETENDIAEVRCVLVTDVKKLKKEDTCLRKKTIIGICHTTYFTDIKLEARSAQASKMKLYETLAQLLNELKELDDD